MNTVIRAIKDWSITPQKRLGQSFLTDSNIMQKIVDAALLSRDDLVVEIGAGLGVMTEIIASRARNVIAIDIDGRMIDVMRKRFEGYDNIEIIETDVLCFDFSLNKKDLTCGKLKIIGNIPYNISSQIFFRLIGFRRHIDSAILMVQKEVSDRITASAGTKSYGIPSVIAATYTVATRLMNVPPGCFFPSPKVESSVIKLTMGHSLPVHPVDDDFFMKVVRTAFGKRRKTLLNNLRDSHLLPYSVAEIRSLLARIGVDAARRGETFSAEEFVRLSNALWELREDRQP